MPVPVASAPSLPAVMRALRTKSLLRRADATPDAEATVMPLKLAMSTCARIRASHENQTGGRGVRGLLRGSGGMLVVVGVEVAGPACGSSGSG